ncbi:MAG: single-stranded-DNA-specific exonuclease RecJ [Hespellia sp.]|nr:single-stranded-DNA-specific exonuclease RecJ [Hespellia sp.]
MEKWFLTMKKADFNKIAEKYHISPIIARLIRNRDIIEDKDIDFYLNGTIADLYDGILMRDMDQAVDILKDKIQDGSRIRVIGDYDIDGINATYILQQGLGALGADVDTDIPDRIKDGYGLNKDLIDRALDDEVDTVITCDNGIAAAKEIEYGKSCGMTIIVTDHHQVPYEETDGEKEYLLPMADAVVDPVRADCEYPFPRLCGAAIAYKLIETLFEVMGKDVDEVDYLMENVAIATVGDVMDLVGENRIFVKQGLEMLRRTSNLGLKALMECTGVDPQTLSVYHIGFVLGPCMNASGRLDTAKRTLELLNAKNRRDAVMLAGDLKALNDSRKEMTQRGLEDAIEQVEHTSLMEDRVLVIYLPDCHESIAGIIAGRLKERYYKPVFVLTQSEEGIKGSGRSIDAYHMYDELCKCRGLLTKFGGHKMAAGLSMEEANILRFRETMNELCFLTEEDLVEKVSIDMQLPLEYISEELVQQLELLAPFGMGNRKPLFAERDLKVLNPKIFGKNRNVLKCTVRNSKGTSMDALYFGEAEECLEYIKGKSGLSITFYPGINEYMGNRTLQITIVNYK